MTAESDKRLYVILWPNYALVASMLSPEEFGRHYALGSSRYYQGKTVFAEIDPGFRNDYFPIDRVLESVNAKADGSPKRTKFISCYRVLEHVNLSAYRKLYLTTTEGEVLGLDSASYDRKHDPGYIRTFQEICPLRTIVLTYMHPVEFGNFITNPEQTKSAPSVFFTQIDLNIDEFLTQIEHNPFHASPIPNVHPQKLRDQILEVKANPEKRVKGISLDSGFGRISFLKLRTGFWLASEKDENPLFYPMPDAETLSREHYGWARSLEP